MPKTKSANLYNEHSIITETPREFTRRTPATYLGSQRKNTNLMKEVFANAIDEVSIGHGDVVNVTIDVPNNTYIVEDFGQGFLINAGIDEDGETILQRSFDKMNTSGKTSADGVYNGTALGLNGIGAKLTNWLSTELDVISHRDGQFEHIWFKDGIFERREVGKSSRDSGTIVTWHPDPQFFTENAPDEGALRDHFEIICALLPNLTINLNCNGKLTTYTEPGGINAYVSRKVKDKELFSNRFVIERAIGKDKLNICITYTSDYTETMDSYVNLGHTDSGMHIQAFHTAFTKAINKYANDVGILKKNDRNFTTPEISAGLYVSFNLTTTSAKYDAQSKTRIDDVDAKIINAVIGGDFATWLMNNPGDAKIITERALTERKSREAAQKAKEKIREASKVNKKSIFVDMPSKLNDAYPKNKADRSQCELYIGEGDSACSSITAVKDSSFQAVYPIRGKILNCQKAPAERVYANTEIANITKALGLDIDKTTGKLIYNEKKLRYDKIIFACFTGDTKVKALDGHSYSFNELVDSGIDELWVYSMDNQGNIVPGLAKNIRQVSTTSELLEITLDNGETIRCTPDHFMLTANGQYVMAKDLSENDSLMPLYTKIADDGHEQYFDRTNGKYAYTHRMVADIILADEKQATLERLANEEHSINQNSVVVHHKNVLNPDNKLDNRPENLQWLTNKEHFNMHSKLGYTQYNVSVRHRQRISELHKNGTTYAQNNWRDNGYNGSPKHIEDIRRAHQAGKYKTFSENGYNSSKKHNETICRVNQSEAHITSNYRTDIGKSLRFLIENGLEIDEYNYNFYRARKAKRWDAITDVFQSIDDAIMFSNSRAFDMTSYIPAHSFMDDKIANSDKNKIAFTIKKMIFEHIDFNEQNYNDYITTLKQSSYRVEAPEYRWITKYYDTVADAYAAGENYNHTITSIKSVKVENEPVYCMSVDKYHNFALEGGVFVKNCDEDEDGYAIASLLLTVFNWLCPELIEKGHIYRVHGALFKATFSDDTYVLFQTKTEFENWKKTNTRTYKVSRAKGLGELTRDETYEQLVNPATRNLHQLVADDMAQFDEYLEMFQGAAVDPRRQYLEEHYADYEED